MSKNCKNMYNTIYVYAQKYLSYKSTKLEPCAKDGKEIMVI
jgi:hypothetical protein